LSRFWRDLYYAQSKQICQTLFRELLPTLHNFAGCPVEIPIKRMISFDNAQGSMGGTMHILEPPSDQPLSASQAFQIRALLQEIAQETGAIVLTEDLWPMETSSLEAELGVEQFTLVVSEVFSALFHSKTLAPQPEATPPRSNWEQEVSSCQVGLSFDPDTMAGFLDRLCARSLSESALCQAIEQARAVLPASNSAQWQSQFTLRLIARLTHARSNSAPDAIASTGSAQPMETVLQQQIQQERLLNQVTTQIRQSLELPVILQTAVEQVRQVLRVDRLVIYRFDTEVSSATPFQEAALSHATPEDSPLDQGGSVIYEARVSSEIPSVLRFSEAHCFVRLNQPRLSDRKRPIAVEDVNTRYSAAPCLLDFLQQAKIRAKLVVPILIRDRLWGLLIAHQCDRPRRWQDSEQRFLHQIAEHLAIAISQAQLYAELQQQKRTLEQRVIKRTQELHDVMQSAQSANRAKSEFLAAVSHELRTPLTCIIGMSATLQRWTHDTLNERQQNFLQTIHDSGEYLLALINDILDLSQVEAGKMLLSLSEFSLSRLSQQTLKAFEGQAALNDVSLEVDLRIPSQSDRFVADPRRIQQILFNLLDNAIKFTPAAGKVTLRVFAEEKLAIFQVKDQGIGIPEDQLPLLFQKFRQLNAGYQRQYRGTGLGLALTKQLVELHGGWIDVESTIGVGSVFTVRLPMQPLHGNGSTLKTRSAPIANPARGRIVLIENNEENADLVCDVLTAAGYQIVWMLEGSTVINQIEVLQPIAIIMNLQLPDIDGQHLIQRLRQNPMTKHLKIIALTPINLKQQEPEEIAGADACLTQPLRPNLLLQTVMLLTNIQSSPDHAPDHAPDH
jgi:two-component system, sensor histidine kinase and response regulator